MRNRKTVAESLQALSQLDLNNVKRKLKEPAPEGKGWSDEQVNEAEKWYRRFLELIARFPNLNTVPNYVIDMFWHQHILDTRAYAQDCESIFGIFIHHYPYFGLNGDADKRDNCFEQTDDAYLLLFGESCKELPSFMDAAECCTENPKRIAKGEDCNMSACRADDGAIPRPLIVKGAGCNGGGSGTGCGQGCSRGGAIPKPLTEKAQGCNHSGSGTGCGQGGRGGVIETPKTNKASACAQSCLTPKPLVPLLLAAPCGGPGPGNCHAQRVSLAARASECDPGGGGTCVAGRGVDCIGAQGRIDDLTLIGRPQNPLEYV